MIARLSTVSTNVGRTRARGAALVAGLCLVLAAAPAAAQQAPPAPVADDSGHKVVSTLGNTAAVVAACIALKGWKAPGALPKVAMALGCFGPALVLVEEMISRKAAAKKAADDKAWHDKVDADLARLEAARVEAARAAAKLEAAKLAAAERAAADAAAAKRAAARSPLEPWWPGQGLEHAAPWFTLTPEGVILPPRVVTQPK
jgi:hypothetical protein